MRDHLSKIVDIILIVSISKKYMAEFVGMFYTCFKRFGIPEVLRVMHGL